jgi:hypothetical protein
VIVDVDTREMPECRSTVPFDRAMRSTTFKFQRLYCTASFIRCP